MVENTPSFVEVLDAHRQWMVSNGFLDGSKSFVFVCCGDWDLKTMLPQQCQISNCHKPRYFDRWINIKIPFGKQYGVKKTGMAGMLELLQIPLEGRHHSGIDDSRNIIKIVRRLIEDGAVLDVTTTSAESPAAKQLRKLEDKLIEIRSKLQDSAYLKNAKPSVIDASRKRASELEIEIAKLRKTA